MIGRIRLFIAASILSITITSGECATVEEAKLVKAISDSKLVSANYRVAVTISADEAIVSAYLNDASKAINTDAKIDAVLLAQKVSTTIEHISRVKSRFYNSNQSLYREVTVTAGDIAAFKSGALSQDKLLASLDVNVVHCQSEAPAKSPVGAQAKPATQAESTAPIPNLYRGAGLLFYYPKTWVQKKVAEEGEQGRLISTAARGDAVVVIKIENTSPEGAAQRDKQSWLAQSNTEKAIQLGWQQPIELGYSRKIKGLDLLVQRSSENERTLERHIYFKTSPSSQTFHLSLTCSKTEFVALNREFAAMLATTCPSQ